MEVLIINGPMGVGKTTVGKYIADNNPGTAFIDGDWCMDIHPFVGNRETKIMAIDNILHMIGNYKKCSVCKRVVLVWLMDEDWVYQSIVEGIAKQNMEVRAVTLICDEGQLIKRWKNDTNCEWRTDTWLEISLKSLTYFSALEDRLDTSSLSVSQTADIILSKM